MSEADPNIIRAGAFAMATRFEIALSGAEPERLRAAAEAALGEIARAEAMLSPFIETSEISRINAAAGLDAVKVSGEVFGLLEMALDVWKRTEGAFDLTVGPLMRLWGFRGQQATGRVYAPLLKQTMRKCGMHHLHLDAGQQTARLDIGGASLDMGAIGKGFAVRAACEALRECGVTSALVHGGTSSVQAIGSPPGQQAWKIELAAPRRGVYAPVVHLKDRCLSVSAGRGRQVGSWRRRLGHVIDPRTGRPSRMSNTAAVISDDAVLGDALSTALLVLGDAELLNLGSEFKDTGLYVVDASRTLITRNKGWLAAETSPG